MASNRAAWRRAQRPAAFRRLSDAQYRAVRSYCRRWHFPLRAVTMVGGRLMLMPDAYSIRDRMASLARLRIRMACDASQFMASMESAIRVAASAMRQFAIAGRTIVAASGILNAHYTAESSSALYTAASSPPLSPE